MEMLGANMVVQHPMQLFKLRFKLIINVFLIDFTEMSKF